MRRKIQNEGGRIHGSDYVNIDPRVNRLRVGKVEFLFAVLFVILIIAFIISEFLLPAQAQVPSSVTPPTSSVEDVIKKTDAAATDFAKNPGWATYMAEYQAPTHAVLTVTPNNPQDLPDRAVVGDPFALVGWPTDTPTWEAIDWDNATPYLADDHHHWGEAIGRASRWSIQDWSRDDDEYTSCETIVFQPDRTRGTDPNYEKYSAGFFYDCVHILQTSTAEAAATSTAAKATQDQRDSDRERKDDENERRLRNPQPRATVNPWNPWNGPWSRSCITRGLAIDGYEHRGRNMGTAKSAWRRDCGEPCATINGVFDCLF